MARGRAVQTAAARSRGDGGGPRLSRPRADFARPTTPAELQRSKTSDVLTVSAGPSFIARWLVPRLRRLTERYPDLEVRVLASSQLTDFGREDVDVAIRNGLGIYDGLRSDLLVQQEFFPVCSPTPLSCGPRLQVPDDLAQHVLLHEECNLLDRLDWAGWLAVIGADGIDAQRGLRFSFSHMTLQVAGALLWRARPLSLMT